MKEKKCSMCDSDFNPITIPNDFLIENWIKDLVDTNPYLLKDLDMSLEEYIEYFNEFFKDDKLCDWEPLEFFEKIIEESNKIDKRIMKN